MSALDPAVAGPLEIAALVRRGEVSAREVATLYIRRAERLDPRLGAFVSLDAEGALAAAERVDAAVAAGRDPGPLAGVPVGLKDNLVTRDLPTTCGSAMLAGWRAPYDAAVVERLRAAGAVVLGKLNMDEFAMGSSNETSAAGPCRNPWNLDRVPGGSSGGSAAAVAARLCPAALGSDTGGSIRQPAALCGVTGLKPTYGRVSRRGLVAFASSLDQVGPLAATVEGCAALLEAIGGHDPGDATSLPEPAGAYLAACGRPVTGLRVGVPREYFTGDLDPEVGARVEEAIDRLVAAGARRVPLSLPHTRHAVSAYYLIAMAEASANLARYDGVRYGLRVAAGDLRATYEATRARGFGDEVKRRILLGTFALSRGYQEAFYGKAQRVRTLVARDFAAAFEACDLIATPTSPVPAFPLGERAGDPLRMYLADVFTLPASLAGLPGLSLPCGFTAGGLPVGLQLIAPPLAEARLLQAGAAYQRLTDWHARLPEVAA